MTAMQVHMDTMAFFWTTLVNLIILAGFFSAFKIAKLAHMLGGSVIVGISLWDSYAVFIKHSGDANNGSSFYFHVVFGTLCLCAIIFLAIAGMLEGFAVRPMR